MKPKENKNNTIISYIVGFVTSVVLTLVAYTLVIIHISSKHETIPHEVLIPAIIIIAFIQLVIQLVFFLHLGKEKGPRWNLAVFISTFSLVLLVVVATLWIMSHLNYNMTTKQMEQYIQNQEGF